ncbi:MAG TPA: 2-C-methyl-D-erythritol 4-phosphate cytidylyltransferase [Acidimicrobiales bacterium]
MASAVWTIVVAGGSGARFGAPKQFSDLNGRPVLAWAVAAAHTVSEGVVLVLPAGGAPWPDSSSGARVVVTGGATRSESVRHGLAAVPPTADVVVVHDAARPFATPELFERVVGAVRAGADGAVPGIPLADTVKEIDGDGVVVATPDRARLVAVQTPQAFRAAALRAAHAAGGDATDDASLIEARGGRVVVVAGERHNLKITEPDDLEWARSLARRDSGAA